MSCRSPHPPRFARHLLQQPCTSPNRTPPRRGTTKIAQRFSVGFGRHNQHQFRNIDLKPAASALRPSQTVNNAHFAPEGHHENSPTLQRWVRPKPPTPVPKGRLSPHCTPIPPFTTAPPPTSKSVQEKAGRLPLNDRPAAFFLSYPKTPAKQGKFVMLLTNHMPPGIQALFRKFPNLFRPNPGDGFTKHSRS